MRNESCEIQRGLTWCKLSKYNTCSFVSKRHNLYTEVKSNKRGPEIYIYSLFHQFTVSQKGEHFYQINNLICLITFA